jgi:hypothetical protein
MYSCDTAGGAASPGRDRNLRMTGHGIKTGYSGRFGRTVAQVLSRHARGFFGCVLRKRSASWNGLWIFWRSVAGGDDLRFNREVCWGFLRGLQSCGGGRLECGRRADIGSLARLLRGPAQALAVVGLAACMLMPGRIEHAIEPRSSLKSSSSGHSILDSGLALPCGQFACLAERSSVSPCGEFDLLTLPRVCASGWQRLPLFGLLACRCVYWVARACTCARRPTRSLDNGVACCYFQCALC